MANQYVSFNLLQSDLKLPVGNYEFIIRAKAEQADTVKMEVLNTDDTDKWINIYSAGAVKILCLKPFKGKLYAGTSDGKIYVTEDGVDFSLAFDTGETEVHCLEGFEDCLYAGTGNNGYVYKYDEAAWVLDKDTGETDVFCFKVFYAGLYVGTGANGKLFRLKGGSWAEYMDLAEASIFALGTNNSNLYAGTGANGKINRLIFGLSMPVLTIFDSPSTYPSGLTHDGTNIWSCDRDENKIYKHDGGDIDTILNTYDGLPIKLTVADFQANAATGTAATPQNINDNNIGTSTDFTPVNEYCEIALNKAFVINQFRFHDSTFHNGNGKYKLQYYDSDLASWVDWKTGISVTTGAGGWTTWVTITEIQTTKIRIVATEIDTIGFNRCREWEMRYNGDLEGPDNLINGLAWGGSRIWSCGKVCGKGVILKYNVDMSLDVQYNAPSNNPSGLTSDGTNIWSCDSGTNKIYKHDTNIVDLLATYDSPGSYPYGLTWDDAHIWSCDSHANRTYKHNADMTVDFSYFRSVAGIAGLTWDGFHIWGCNSISGKIYKHKIIGTVYDSTDTNIYALKSFESGLYAGGDGGNVYKTLNGDDWSIAYATGEAEIRGLFTLGGLLYAGTSSNGKLFVLNGTWALSKDLEDTAIYAGVTFNNQNFIGTGANGNIYAYRNGILASEQKMLTTTYALYKLAFSITNLDLNDLIQFKVTKESGVAEWANIDFLCFVATR